MINEVKAVWPWMGNVVEAVYTVAHGLWVTFRTWIKTYRPDRKTFTEHFEYPELARSGGSPVSRLSSL